MRAFDDHIACRVNVYERRVSRVRFHEPDDYGDVVGDALERHGNSAVGLEEIDGAAIVVSEGSGFRVERRVSGEERDEMLTD